MNYTHKEELTCGFEPMEYKGISMSHDDILREN